MKEMNLTGDYAKLEEYYIQNVVSLVESLSPSNGYIVWQEVFDNGVKVRN